MPLTLIIPVAYFKWGITNEPFLAQNAMLKSKYVVNA